MVSNHLCVVNDESSINPLERIILKISLNQMHSLTSDVKAKKTWKSHVFDPDMFTIELSCPAFMCMS